MQFSQMLPPGNGHRDRYGMIGRQTGHRRHSSGPGRKKIRTTITNMSEPESRVLNDCRNAGGDHPCVLLVL
jgi:hypothetical protein